MSLSSQYQALIFDWDGTRADSVTPIIKALQYAHSQMGFAFLDPNTARQVIGLSLQQAMLYTAPQANPQQIAQLIRHYYQYYLHHDQTALSFKQARYWLPRFSQKYWLGVASGKSRQGLEKALIDTDFKKWFMATRTIDECAAKPNPDMVLSLCDEWGLSPSEVLVIGDTSYDLLMAANAGADAVALTTGAHDIASLRQAPHQAILSDLNQLAEWLNIQPNQEN